MNRVGVERVGELRIPTSTEVLDKPNENFHKGFPPDRATAPSDVIRHGGLSAVSPDLVLLKITKL
jgi:hypothetical protein